MQNHKYYWPTKIKNHWVFSLLCELCNLFTKYMNTINKIAQYIFLVGLLITPVQKNNMYNLYYWSDLILVLISFSYWHCQLLCISGRLVQDQGDHAKGSWVDPGRDQGVWTQGEGRSWLPHWHEVELHEPTRRWKVKNCNQNLSMIWSNP